MTDLENLARWQATLDMAVYKFEKRTGLRLAGLPPSEIAERIAAWATDKSPEMQVRHRGLGPGVRRDDRKAELTACWDHKA